MRFKISLALLNFSFTHVRTQRSIIYSVFLAPQQRSKLRPDAPSVAREMVIIVETLFASLAAENPR